MSRIVAWIGVVGVVALAAAGCAVFTVSKHPPLETVPSVDIPRYMGVWHEVAKYPNRFQKGCFGASATYTLRPDGAVDVVNRCRDGSFDGPVREARGKAVVVDGTTNAKLSVTFFWPFSGDYQIIALGDSYEYAVVGEPSRKYLWILAREARMEAARYASIIEILRRNGYDPSRLEWSLPTPK